MLDNNYFNREIIKQLGSWEYSSTPIEMIENLYNNPDSLSPQETLIAKGIDLIYKKILARTYE